MEVFIAKLTGWEADTLGLQRTLLRINLLGNSAIGVHYNYVFLRHGEESVLTSWIPIGDINLEEGGLIYLEHLEGNSTTNNLYSNHHHQYHTDTRVAQGINWVETLSMSSQSVRLRAGSHQSKPNAHTTRT